MKPLKNKENLENYYEREFPFMDRDFLNIKRLVEGESGIILSEQKKAMIYGRLAPRIRKLGLKDFGEYCRLLGDKDEDELDQLIDIITTNVTKFFRENHHFEFLKDYVAGLAAKYQIDKTLRIWSAGCSTGEEPYSTAMIMEEFLPSNWRYDILATDLCTTALSHAKKRIYREEQLEDIDKKLIKKWFKKGTRENAGKVKISSELRNHIRFEKLNLLNEVDFSRQFDVVFCRNVIIYFDKEFKLQLLKAYHRALKEDGYLIIGHSESILGMESKFAKTPTKTVFQKIGR